jgi:hypothetical protein
MRLLPGALLPSAAVVGSPAYVGLHCFTDLDASSSMLDKQAVVVKLVFAYDVRSRRPNWGNLRLLDSEVLGEHLFDRLRTPLEHYKSSLPHRSLLTLKQSRQPLSWQLSYPYTPPCVIPGRCPALTPSGSNAPALAAAYAGGQLTISAFREGGILFQKSARYRRLEPDLLAMMGIKFVHACTCAGMGTPWLTRGAMALPCRAS